MGNLQKIIDFGNIKELISEMEYEEIEDSLILDPGDENYEFQKKYNLERHLSPLKIQDLDIPTFIISIKAVWAEQLFNDRSNEKLHLFESKNELLLNRENVYYRSSSRNLSAPARILWYISKNPITKEKGHIKAVSYIDEIFIDDAKKLFKQFKQLGIYNWKDIQKTIDKNGKIMAFVFSDTELFKRPVDLKFIKGLLKTKEEK